MMPAMLYRKFQEDNGQFEGSQSRITSACRSVDHLTRAFEGPSLKVDNFW
jgi:hypothetical protein